MYSSWLDSPILAHMCLDILVLMLSPLTNCIDCFAVRVVCDSSRSSSLQRCLFFRMACCLRPALRAEVRGWSPSRGATRRTATTPIVLPTDQAPPIQMRIALRAKRGCPQPTTSGVNWRASHGHRQQLKRPARQRAQTLQTPKIRRLTQQSRLVPWHCHVGRELESIVGIDWRTLRDPRIGRPRCANPCSRRGETFGNTPPMSFTPTSWWRGGRP